MKQDFFKGYKMFKLIQLIILILFAATSFLYLYLDPELRYNLYNNRSLLAICIFLWAFMIYSAVCIILDFYQLEGHIEHENVLNRAVYMDSLTGIPNRIGVDMVFEEYAAGKEVLELGCALIHISNLEMVNRNKGRTKGNLLLVDFSHIIELVGAHYGFVGRNNGNDFLVVIDKCDEEKMKRFIKEIQDETDSYNKKDENEDISLEVNYVINDELNISNFNDLIARLYSKARG